MTDEDREDRMHYRYVAFNAAADIASSRARSGVVIDPNQVIAAARLFEKYLNEDLEEDY